MAPVFPDTPFLDDFNRADGGLGANWTAGVEPALSTPVIFSNAVSGVVSAYNTAYWNPTSFGADQECYLTIPASASGQDYTGLYTRITNPGATINCYNFIAHPAASFELNRLVNNVNSGPLGTFSGIPATGWKVGMRIRTVGPDYIIEGYYDSGSGWTLSGLYEEAGGVAGFPALNGGGNIGFIVFGSGVASALRQIDDFGGGTVSASIDDRQRTFDRNWLPKYKGKVLR